jgi:hypothetical protein
MSAPEKTPRLRRDAELAKLKDEALMLRLQLGHHDALAVLFDRYHRPVVNIGLRILRDAGEAEDLLPAAARREDYRVSTRTSANFRKS